MNLHQFRFVQEAARRNLNLTETARVLHTSQPGVSKAIIELEEELGIEIFARHGKRLKRITEPGEHVLASIRVIMREVGNLRRIGEQFSAQDSGTLSIATTHTQARYVLPQPIAKLRQAFPKVNVSLQQGAPDQVAQMVLDEVAEIGIATESLAHFPDLVTLPCYEWQHLLVMPQGHPLARLGARNGDSPITLQELALEPLITYHPSFTGRTRIDAAFRSQHLKPRIALEAIDSDVIKTYVQLGLGVGIVAEMAMLGDAAGLASLDNPARSATATADSLNGSLSSSGLVAVPAGALFGMNVARVAFKRSAYLRDFVYRFAEMVSPKLNRDHIMKAMAGKADEAPPV